MLLLVIIMAKAKIITFTGVSGTGKTTIANQLLKDENNFHLVTSTTTRKARPSDLSGEYEYLNLEGFQTARTESAFIWCAEHGGNHYGTRYKFIDNALTAPYTSIMILVPEVLPILLDYAGKNVLPFYVRSPSESDLRTRLAVRGEPQESIEKRLQQSKAWESNAENSGIPYKFITNLNGKLDEALEQVKKHLVSL